MNTVTQAQAAAAETLLERAVEHYQETTELMDAIRVFERDRVDSLPVDGLGLAESDEMSEQSVLTLGVAELWDLIIATAALVGDLTGLVPPEDLSQADYRRIVARACEAQSALGALTSQAVWAVAEAS